MQEVFDQIMSFVRGGWRFRWYLHLIAWPICLGGWAFVYKMPDQYEASARVYVDTQSVLRPLLKGLAVQVDFAQEVALMTRTLLSRPNIEKIARMTDMDLEASTPEDMEALLDRLQHKIKFSGGGRNNLYSLTYTDKNPDKAKQVVQSLLTLFVETSLGDSRKDTDVAQRFLNEKIADYESRLLAAETSLMEFKRKNMGMMPQEGKEYYQKLASAIERLSGAELELREAQNRRDELQRQLQGEVPTFGMLAPPLGAQSPAQSALDSRIQSMQEQLDTLLLRYTKKHPDVKSLKETITVLKKQRDDEAAQMKSSGDDLGGSNLSSNPVYQQLRISLGETEALVAGLIVRADRYRADVSRLRGAVDVIPEVEAQLKRLNRDYEINKKNYQELVERRESAKLSEQADQTSDNVRFRIVDPPFVPIFPVAPNRPLLVSIVLLVAFISGAVFAIFLSQVRPPFDSAKEITRVLGLPVFGSVSRVWTGNARLKRRAEVFAFASGGAALIALYGVYMVYFVLADNFIG